MKKIKWLMVALLPVGIMLLSQCSSSTDPLSDNTNTSIVNETLQAPTLDGTYVGALDEAEQEGLVYMREEEKLARDVYLTLDDLWNVSIFSNIAMSEQTHTDAIKTLLDRYQVTDPVQEDVVGKFTNEKLQELYNALIDMGNVSLVEALKVGAAIEEIDILDLQKEIALVQENDDIILVYESLMKGSRNHLRSFVKTLATEGVNYEPQYLDTTTFEDIVSTELETGQ